MICHAVELHYNAAVSWINTYKANRFEALLINTMDVRRNRINILGAVNAITKEVTTITNTSYIQNSLPPAVRKCG